MGERERRLPFARCAALYLCQRFAGVHLFAELFHPSVFEVFIEGHQPVDDTVGCQLDDAVGDRLKEGMVMPDNLAFPEADREAVYRAINERRDVRGQFRPDALAPKAQSSPHSCSPG